MVKMPLRNNNKLYKLLFWPFCFMLLSNKQQDFIMKQVRVEAYKKCDIYMKAFMECSKDKYLSMPFKCRSLYNEMNECLILYNNDETRYQALLDYQKLLKTENPNFEQAQ
eukprot:NODE_11_length_54881_cov_1.430718.p42 type:complete len:110 gc:universal NODE_11_length_54881_cov_1.430718:19435-19106(-)